MEFFSRRQLDQVKWLCALLILGCGVVMGCNSSSGAPVSPAAPPPPESTLLNLQGDWVGRLSGSEDGMNGPLTATIRQSGEAIMISTSLAGLGANFSGTLDSDGHLRLTDAFDGETWTTYFGPASATDIDIADFIRPPSDEEFEPPLQVISLNR